jgi:hypothetical protein
MARKLLLPIVAGQTLSAGALAMAPAAGAAPTPPSNCTIVPETFADGNVGTLNTWFFSTTGCSTSKKPVQFKVVDGRIPPGTTLFTQGVSSGGITGEPTTEGVFAFDPGPRRDRDEGHGVLLDYDQPAAAAGHHESE